MARRWRPRRRRTSRNSQSLPALKGRLHANVRVWPEMFLNENPVDDPDCGVAIKGSLVRKQFMTDFRSHRTPGYPLSTAIESKVAQSSVLIQEVLLNLGGSIHVKIQRRSRAH